MPAALVPRPWDFAPAPTLTIQPAPAEDPAKPSQPTDPADPSDSPPSPSIELPPSRPASPPTLLPPITIHETSFHEPAVNSAPPVDDVEVEKSDDGSGAEDLPIVAIVPPTPTSIVSTSSAETATAA